MTMVEVGLHPWFSCPALKLDFEVRLGDLGEWQLPALSLAFDRYPAPFRAAKRAREVASTANRVTHAHARAPTGETLEILLLDERPLETGRADLERVVLLNEIRHVERG